MPLEAGIGKKRSERERGRKKEGKPHINVRGIDATDGCKTASERGNRNKRHDMADTWRDDGREDVRILSGRKKQSQRAS